MFTDVYKNEWVSANGKWKVSVIVKEQLMLDGQKIFINNINVYSFVSKNRWKNENQNEKLPKYVAAELQKAREIVGSLRKGVSV